VFNVSLHCSKRQIMNRESGESFSTKQNNKYNKQDYVERK